MPYYALDPSTAQAAPVTSIGAPATVGGAYTLDELYQELMLRLGDRTDVTKTRATRWINDAITDIAESLGLPGLKGGVAFNTAVDQPLYLLPANIKKANLVSVVNVGGDPVNGRKLQELDERKFRMLPDVKGSPTHYLASDKMIVLYPTPTEIETVLVDGVFNPANLDALDPTKKHILGSTWNEGLLRLATSYGFNALIEPELAANAENQYIIWVRRKDDPEAQNTNTVARFSVPRSEKDLRRARYPDTQSGSDDAGRW